MAISTNQFGCVRTANSLFPSNRVARMSLGDVRLHAGPRITERVQHVEAIVADHRTVLSPTSFWNVPLAADTLVDANSAAVVAELVRQASNPGNLPIVNRNSWTASIEVVPPDQPLMPVTLLGSRTDSPFTELRKVFATGLPIPDGWQPLADRDSHGVFYQPDYIGPTGYAGRLYEAWRLRQENGVWVAEWGGRMTNTHTSVGWYVDWMYSGYQYGNPGHPDSTYQRKQWGGTATSLPLAAGTITREDQLLGRIDHALGVATISPGAGFRAPAQRGDGSGTNPIIEGMRLRLPADHVPQCPHPLARMVEELAARGPGFVVWDKAGALSFRAEPTVDLGGTPSYLVLEGFPWDRLQVLA